MVDKELVRIAIGIKTELLGDKTKRNICLVTVQRTMSVLFTESWCWRAVNGDLDLRSAHVAQGSKALTTDKHVHQVCTHLDMRGVNIELEETMVIA